MKTKQIREIKLDQTGRQAIKIKAREIHKEIEQTGEVTKTILLHHHQAEVDLIRQMIKIKDKQDPSKDKGKAKESDGESQENSTKDKGKGKLTDKDEVRAVHDSAARKSTVPPSPLELPPPVVTPPGQEITADHETASVHKAASEHETASEHEITADKKTTSEREITAGKKITPGDEITPDKKTTSGEENTSGDGHPPPRRWRGIWSDLRHGEGTTRQRFTRAYRDAKAKLGSKGGRKKQQPPGG